MRYRNIHCKIWNDDKFPFASDDCQLIVFHILTTPMSTPYGLYKASLPALAAEKRWPVKRYEKAFREALRLAFLKYDERHHLIFIPRFLEYNPPQSPNVLKSWQSSYEELPDSALKNEFNQKLKAFVEGKGEGFKEAFSEAFPKVCRKTPAPDTDTDTDKEGGGKKTLLYIGLFPEAFRNSGDFRNQWGRWLKHRKEKRNSITPTTAEAQAKFLTKHSVAEAADIVSQSIEKGWTGLFELKDKPKERQGVDVAGQPLKVLP